MFFLIIENFPFMIYFIFQINIQKYEIINNYVVAKAALLQMQKLFYILIQEWKYFFNFNTNINIFYYFKNKYIHNIIYNLYEIPKYIN